MNNWQTELRTRLERAGLRGDLLEVEFAKDVACTSANQGFDKYTDDSMLWAIMRQPHTTLEQKRVQLAAAAAAYMHAVREPQPRLPDEDSVGPVSDEEEYAVKRLASLNAQRAGEAATDQRQRGLLRRIWRALSGN